MPPLQKQTTNQQDDRNAGEGQNHEFIFVLTAESHLLCLLDCGAESIPHEGHEDIEQPFDILFPVAFGVVDHGKREDEKRHPDAHADPNLFMQK